MKTTRLTTYWTVEQVIDQIELLDELRDALVESYRQELDEYHQQRCVERNKNEADNMSLFDDTIDF